MATTAKLFVAFSHTLTQSQIDGFISQYGVPNTTNDLYEAGALLGKIATLKEGSNTNPVGYWYYDWNKWYETKDSVFIATNKIVLQSKLQAQMSQIPATATLTEIQSLAKAIVAEAVKAGATHFYCVGEPTLTMWANLYASQTVPFYGLDWNTGFEELVCIQSTTERRSVDVHNPDGTVSKTAVFQHVQWREMF
jgi:hypothetical protein